MYSIDEIAISKEINEAFLELVSIKSDTGTELEKDIEKFQINWLSNLKYFKDNPNNFGNYILEDDPLNRAVVWGLVKGTSKETIILLHHHDAVDSYDYGVLQDYAYDPKTLAEKFQDVDINKDTKKDLDSNKWIFGRGTSDMKAGAAIQMVLLKHYSQLENFSGNVLLLSVPDEESLSLGVRGGVNLLNEIKEKFDLEYRLCIDSEPHQKDSEGNGVLYEGSVGKTMVVVYARGKKTHLGDIFQGINPVAIMSEIVSNIDMNPIFSDEVEGEVSPPPSWSFCRDTKEQYDASIPESAGGYFSILTLSSTPKEILEKVYNISEQSFESVISRMNENYRIFQAKGNKQIEKLPWEPKVLLFSDAYKQAVEDSGEVFIKDYNETIIKIKNDIKEGKTNIPDSTLVLIGKTLDYIRDKSPIVVISFSPPYYPHIANRDFLKLPENIKNISKEIINYAKEELDKNYVKLNYFMGISDMSYLALNDSEEVIPFISPNMPHWEKMYSVPFENMKKLSIPIINIGPWGKDYHKFTERVSKDDLLVITPKLISFTIEYLLSI